MNKLFFLMPFLVVSWDYDEVSFRFRWISCQKSYFRTILHGIYQFEQLYEDHIAGQKEN